MEMSMQKWILIFLSLLYSTSPYLDASTQHYLLPVDHFLQKPLADLFQDSKMFATRENLRKAGFQLFKRRHSGLMVAKHPSIKGFLIKKYIDDVPQEKQLHNYLARAKGSRALTKFIKAENLQHIITPKKWLYPLPQKVFGQSYLLIVEEIDICSSAESEKNYSEIAPAALEELCLVLTRFRGLDSIVKNMPFTHQGKIAFVDTEHWKDSREKFLPHILPLLDEERQNIVRAFTTSSPEIPVEDSLLPEDHPLQKKLSQLFTTASLFNTPETLRQAGFKVNKRVHKGLMVFTHPDIKDYVFKKFQNSTPRSYQLQKYMKRLEGAKTVRDYIQANNLQHIVVPNKWLYRLPFGDYLVIAERMEICDGDDRRNGENVQRYRTMSYETLTELCQIMHALEGCDAWPRNQPFTLDGKIAFIDTEHVGQKETHFIRHILPLFDEERKAYAGHLMGTC
jgi:hypothetical protein